MDLQESHAENYLEEPGHNGAGWERGRGGGRRAGRERAGGQWFSVLVSENGFSKYSGKIA